MSIAGDRPPFRRGASPASNSTWPDRLSGLAGGQNPRCFARDQPHLGFAAGHRQSVEASELTNTWMPSLPENAEMPRSETMNHCVASEESSSLPGPLAAAVIT